MAHLASSKITDPQAKLAVDHDKIERKKLMQKQEMDSCIQPPRAEAIAHLNDTLRKTRTGGTVVVTQSVMRLTGFDPTVLAVALADYEGFDADNDPHGERDFGDLMLWGTDLLFKIEYYDTAMQFGSENPADPEVTTRVLTVMTTADW